MRRTRIVLGACVGLVAAPAFAADVLVYEATPPPSGNPVYAAQSMIAADVGLALGYFWWNDNVDRYDSETGEIWGSGRINIAVGQAFNQEFEVSGLTGFESDSYYSYGAFSHTYWKSPTAAAGLLLGGSSIAGNGALTVGGEGAVFLPSATLVGLLAYTWGDDQLSDFWTASAEGRWYWNANTKLTGTVTYNDYNSAWMLSAGGEHRIAGTMASIFADANYFTNDTGNGWELFAGGRLFFDIPARRCRVTTTRCRSQRRGRSRSERVALFQLDRQRSVPGCEAPGPRSHARSQLPITPPSSLVMTTVAERG